MDYDRIEMYLMTNSKYFPEQKLSFLKQKLYALDESRLSMITMMEMKDPTTYLLISIFIGSLGIDRFMLGDTGMGILKLLTGGLCGILTIYDWVTIMSKTKEANFSKIMTIM